MALAEHLEVRVDVLERMNIELARKQADLVHMVRELTNAVKIQAETIKELTTTTDGILSVVQRLHPEVEWGQ